MINLKIKNLDSVLKQVEEKIKTPTDNALEKVGFFLMDYTRKFLEDPSKPNWRAAHPMTQSVKREKDGGWSHQSRAANYENLGKFARFIQRKSESIITGFGVGKKRLDKKLMGFSETMLGKTIPVTDKMRKKRGAMRGGITNPIVGSSFFPLKKSTEFIEIPERLIPYETNDVFSKFFDEYHQKFIT